MCWNSQVVRVLVLHLEIKAGTHEKVKGILFAEK
jgi:hypothetical protein